MKVDSLVWSHIMLILTRIVPLRPDFLGEHYLLTQCCYDSQINLILYSELQYCCAMCAVYSTVSNRKVRIVFHMNPDVQDNNLEFV